MQYVKDFLSTHVLAMVRLYTIQENTSEMSCTGSFELFLYYNLGDLINVDLLWISITWNIIQYNQHVQVSFQRCGRKASYAFENFLKVAKSDFVTA
jgi:hypothetical protein